MGIDKFRRKAVFKGKMDALDDITMKEAKNIVVGTTTGSKIGTSVNQKLGLWNKTPIIQPKSADQADQGAMTSSVIGDTVSTSGGWGASTEANADKIHAAIDQLVADVAALDILLTAVRTALVNAGIMKGAA